ncbi:MAG TPA: RNA 2',3'-cyclic phosphodiesterase [Kiritimatiellia bacterium]|jgi:2'-5' RNA ligase|nr:RNA 2',3'-cyclic phosphodiesterase [Kiritimatiellia bacterium]OQC59961.1 MAG: 2',5' RNA ligase family [Verrucomicrobia bacterium ADurb.Bin018]MBP9572388.1 RNA 2',3'-cyclic phosphodiesterase [Kiritimatiellia bacterium]HOD99642.1 RNA 2',3'-cyclic phosphodiesterase [Kiritimatiellia bacterium]HOE36397.1 RNA 2',3'-cyclic phosphodiesterase [Kiritimatiellia bacterium]
MNTKRLFAGVKVAATAALRAELAAWQQALRGERIRWTRPENLHLTIEFFGATEEGRIPELKAALAQAAAATKTFAIKLGGAGTFGGARSPRVLWLGVESAGLEELHGRVVAALAGIGWNPEAREFAPHLTLGRISRLQDTRRFGEALESRRAGVLPEQPVNELVLFASVTGRYVPVGSWGLGGG